MIHFAESLTVYEWGLLIGFIVGGVIQILTALGYTQKAKQVKAGADKGTAMIHAIEEFADEHPELATKLRGMAKDKAADLGVELGPLGLKADVVRERRTRSLKKQQDPNA